MRKKLGEILVDGGLIDDFQLQASLGHQRQWGGRIGEIVVSKGFTTAEAVADALALQLGIERFQMGPDAVEEKAAKLIASDLADRQMLIPFRLEGDRGDVLWIAMNDPTDLATLDEIQFQTGKRIKMAAASEQEIRAMIAHVYEGKPLPEPAPPAVVLSVDPEELAEAEVLPEVEPLEEVLATPVDAAPAVAGLPPGMPTPPMIGSAAAPLAAPAPESAVQPADLGQASPDAWGVPMDPPPAKVTDDVAADLAALGVGDTPSPFHGGPVVPPPEPEPEPEVEPEPELEPEPEPEVEDSLANFDLESASALIGDALDKMAAGEALPDQARRYVNPTQMAAALTRLLIRKGVIEETDLIDELQKK